MNSQVCGYVFVWTKYNSLTSTTLSFPPVEKVFKNVETFLIHLIEFLHKTFDFGKVSCTIWTKKCFRSDEKNVMFHCEEGKLANCFIIVDFHNMWVDLTFWNWFLLRLREGGKSYHPLVSINASAMLTNSSLSFLLHPLHQEFWWQ